LLVSHAVGGGDGIFIFGKETPSSGTSTIGRTYATIC
jgi:hypothetical protein